MFEKTDKRRIYWVIEQYLSNKIDARTFCDEFHESYDLEVNLSSLTRQESNAFSELSDVAGRFSNIEEDIKQYPGTYFTEKELKAKVIETKKLLVDKIK